MPDDGKPTFDQLRDALMPPGTDKDALWAALKNAQRTGGHVPGRPALDISGTMSPIQAALFQCLIETGRVTPEDMPGMPAGPNEPADPFTKGSEASAALAEMFGDMVDAGIPVASVERILGAMLATYGLMTGDES